MTTPATPAAEPSEREAAIERVLLVGAQFANIAFNLKQDAAFKHRELVGRLQKEWDEARSALSKTEAAPFNLEAMLSQCIPSGQSCEPQQVADSIRAFFAGRVESDAFNDPSRRAFAERIVELACAWPDAVARGEKADAEAEESLWEAAYRGAGVESDALDAADSVHGLLERAMAILERFADEGPSCRAMALIDEACTALKESK